eukprot:Lankesteria_metandrocarpae@DN4527_c0_g1_i1.p1
MVRLIAFGVATSVACSSVFAGICEQGRIPLRTVRLDDESSVCVVPFCGEQEQRRTPNFEDGTIGSITCMKCDQTPWDQTYAGYREKTDVCPAELNTCDKGHCCPKTGTDTWYHQNFKTPYSGMNTFPHVTVTTYGGSTACGGTVADATKYLKDMGTGIDAIAAVPSPMYGSWISNQRAGSQACYVNNNICYKVTDHNDRVWNIAIWGKCGGYTQCNNLAPSDQSIYTHEASTLPGAEIYDANMCLNQKNVSIMAGATPDCLVTAGGDGKSKNGTNCCVHPCQKHVDWCGSNDHVHFDIGEEVYAQMCNYTPCTVKKVEPYLCPWNPPLDPARSNWTPRFSGLKPAGSSEAAPVHEPYPEPHCDAETGGATSPSTDGASTGGLDCDSVVTANLPAELGSCQSQICTKYCTVLASKQCAAATDKAACVANAIQSDLCPATKDCGCTFE